MIKQNTKWSFEDPDSWSEKFSNCSSKYQSPVNISTDTLVNCNILCKLGLNYKKSKCKVSKINNIPIVEIFNTNQYNNNVNDSILNFREKDYNLSFASIHTPSLHTIDGEKYAAEICLWHNPNDIEAVVLSCLYQEGDYSGDSEQFLNQIINNFPKDNSSRKIDVNVSNNWSANLLLPNRKSFFSYQGSMPFPPCLADLGNEIQKVTWIVFEEIGSLGKATIEMLQFNIGKNIRPIQPLNGRNVYYNSNIELQYESNDDKITSPIEIKTDRYLKCVLKPDAIKLKKKKVTVESDDEPSEIRLSKKTREKIQKWFYLIVFILIFISSYKFVVILFETGKAQNMLGRFQPSQKGGNFFSNMIFKIQQLKNRLTNQYSYKDIPSNN